MPDWRQPLIHFMRMRTTWYCTPFFLKKNTFLMRANSVKGELNKALGPKVGFAELQNQHMGIQFHSPHPHHPWKRWGIPIDSSKEYQ